MRDVIDSIEAKGDAEKQMIQALEKIEDEAKGATDEEKENLFDNLKKRHDLLMQSFKHCYIAKWEHVRQKVFDILDKTKKERK